MSVIQKAVTLLRWHNATPGNYFVYVLVKEIPDALERIKFLKEMKLDSFAQPYRDQEGNKPTREQRNFTRWINHKAIFSSVTWEDYRAIKKKKGILGCLLSPTIDRNPLMMS